MSRRSVGMALLAGTLAILLAFWLTLHLERVPVSRHEPPAPEAQRNPYLALERFTARMGGTLVRRSDARFLDRLPSDGGGTLLLDRRRDRLLSPARLQRLLTWVSNGGYLIAVAESPEVDDPLLDAFAVERPGPTSPDGRSEPLDVRLPVDVRLPAQRRRLQVDRAGHALRVGDRAPAWSAGTAGGGAQLLHFAVGRGNVTIGVEFDRMLSNRALGEHDHAELYWSLLTRYDRSSSPQVWVLSRLQMPGLFAWVWEHARAACLSAAVLIVLWLWHVVPRFGPARAARSPARRELREHLAAVGRYLWRSGSLTTLLGPARERLRGFLALRHTAIAGLPPAAQIDALAVLTRRPAASVAAALEGTADSPRAFTDAMRTLRNLEIDLRRLSP